MMEQAIATYREEAGELLAELESSLLELEERPDDDELINRVFRAMHTIKGSGAMFGFDEIAAFTHEVESVFDLVRNGKLTVTRALLDLTLEARDHIVLLLSGTGDAEEGRRIVAGLRRLIPASPEVVHSPEPVPPLPMEQPEQMKTWRIRFRPSKEILRCGTNPLSLLNELRGLGTARVIAQYDDIPTLDRLDPEGCHIYWDIILTTNRGEDAIRDVFIFVEDDCELSIDLIDTGSEMEEEGYKKLGDILVEKGDLSPVDMQKVLSMQKRFGELLVEQGIVTPDKVESALVEQQQVKAIRQERNASVQEGASVRVPAEKLDHLINLVGELVTVQAHLSQVAATGGESIYVSISEEVERLTNELRDTTLNIRMLPIGTTFSKFRRLVRDLSSELGKEIDMETFGAETELDKTVIEKLNDPLVHIIRNSIDHGIEPPEERVASGKPPRGTILLGAEHSGDSVIITIRDDGRGLDREKIRKKGVEKGLIPEGVDLPDREIFAQIFAPGFSTADQVTNVSGRGVGMDVVKRGIEALRGTIRVESQHGKGTTITLKIPLTLAIIDSLLVTIAGGYYVLPLAPVEECIELTREDVQNSHGRNLANVRGEIIPYVSLRELFGLSGDRPAIEQIVIASLQGVRVGFVVDGVVGEHQTVIKSLGRLYRDVKGISGATILGDGTVALILDMPTLLKQVEQMEVRRG
ncbi:MAG: chemotaxis protein CheA [Desulfuromonadia bacterium]